MRYVEQKFWIVDSMHPEAIVAAKARAIAEGFDLGPPWLPNDEGVLYGTRKVDRPVPLPRMVRPPVPAPAPLRIWPVPTVLGLTALVGLIAGVIR